MSQMVFMLTITGDSDQILTRSQAGNLGSMAMDWYEQLKCYSKKLLVRLPVSMIKTCYKRKTMHTQFYHHCPLLAISSSLARILIRSSAVRSASSCISRSRSFLSVPFGSLSTTCAPHCSRRLPSNVRHLYSL
jgi:hypothetical protein